MGRNESIKDCCVNWKDIHKSFYFSSAQTQNPDSNEKDATASAL